MADTHAHVGDDLTAVIKVASVTLGFWVVKILATTLGETGGDALSMQLGLGYLASSLRLPASAGPGLAHARAEGQYAYYLSLKAEY